MLCAFRLFFPNRCSLRRLVSFYYNGYSSSTAGKVHRNQSSSVCPSFFLSFGSDQPQGTYRRWRRSVRKQWNSYLGLGSYWGCSRWPHDLERQHCAFAGISRRRGEHVGKFLGDSRCATFPAGIELHLSHASRELAPQKHGGSPVAQASQRSRRAAEGSIVGDEFSFCLRSLGCNWCWSHVVDEQVVAKGPLSLGCSP